MEEKYEYYKVEDKSGDCLRNSQNCHISICGQSQHLYAFAVTGT